MKTGEKIAIVMFVLLFTAAWVFSEQAYEDVFEQSYPLAAGGRVSLDNVNGDVTVEVWERDEVRVQAVKSAASRELLDRIEIDVDASPNALRIDTEYPSNRGWRRGDDDHMEHGGHMKVEYTLTVPRTAAIEDFDLVNGNLLVVGVEGDIEASTVNGDIVVRDAAGPADLETVNGGIELYLDRARADAEIDLGSVNGAIDLYLPASAAARIQAETVNGHLSNDFGIEVHTGKYVGASFAGTIGGGGPRIEIETVNGRISVHSV